MTRSGFSTRDEFLAEISSKRAVMTQRNPVDSTFLSCPVHWYHEGTLRGRAQAQTISVGRNRSTELAEIGWSRVGHTDMDEETLLQNNPRANKKPMQLLTDRRRNRAELRDPEDDSSSGIYDRLQIDPGGFPIVPESLTLRRFYQRIYFSR